MELFIVMFLLVVRALILPFATTVNYLQLYGFDYSLTLSRVCGLDDSPIGRMIQRINSKTCQKRVTFHPLNAALKGLLKRLVRRAHFNFHYHFSLIASAAVYFRFYLWRNIAS